MLEYGWGGRSIDPNSWQPVEMTYGPSLWGHDPTWLPADQLAASRAMRAKAAADGQRQPVQVIEGNYQVGVGGGLSDRCTALLGHIAALAGRKRGIRKRPPMPDLTLYHAAPSRSSIVHWMLEEVGEPYDIQLISFKKGENLRPEYLAVNPMGKVPALRHGDSVITEAAAICTYLADAFPQAKLNVPVSDPRRGIYLKWLFFGPSCLEPALIERAFPRREAPSRAALGFGDFDTVMNVLAKAVGCASPHLMGEQFTAADVVIGSGLRWGTMFKLLPERPEFTAYIAHLNNRPALKRASEKDKTLQAQQEA